MTKAEEVYTRTEQLVGGGMKKADAFRQLAAEYGQPLGSIRGAYYQHTGRQTGESGENPAPRRPRRRETTPQDALADARAALERAIQSIDREVEDAGRRAEEAKAEYDSLKASAEERKQAITKRLEALQ